MSVAHVHKGRNARRPTGVRRSLRLPDDMLDTTSTRSTAARNADSRGTAVRSSTPRARDAPHRIRIGQTARLASARFVDERPAAVLHARSPRRSTPGCRRRGVSKDDRQARFEVVRQFSRREIAATGPQRARRYASRRFWSEARPPGRQAQTIRREANRPKAQSDGDPECRSWNLCHRKPACDR